MSPNPPLFVDHAQELSPAAIAALRPWLPAYSAATLLMASTFAFTTTLMASSTRSLA
jgi:hypothetical protein